VINGEEHMAKTTSSRDSLKGNKDEASVERERIASRG
jgi:hypothetical protein